MLSVWHDRNVARHEVFAMSEKLFPKKIDRYCPRCKHRDYHWLTHRDSPAALRSDTKHTASCVRCGHEWLVRLMEKDK